MNASQKKGVGLLVAIVVFAVPQVLEAFGVSLPGWVPQAAALVTTICAVLGITVQSPFGSSQR